MNKRPGWLWCIHLRPKFGERNGIADSTIMTPEKDHCRALAAELGDLYTIVWHGWVKHSRTGLLRSLKRMAF